MNTISGKTKLVALLGHPVEHSLSPAIHNEAFVRANLDYVYLCLDVQEEDLETVVNGLRLAGIAGFNLTMPCKNRMAGLCDELTGAAAMTGAVNTVTLADGKFVGHNTDGLGFVRGVREAGLVVEGATATILGGGGVASAICAQLALEGAAALHLFVRPDSRFCARAHALADTISQETACQVTVHESADINAAQAPADLREAVAKSNLFVNATPVGMVPNEAQCPVGDASLFCPNLLVADVIYDPPETRFLQLAREAGCRTLNGLPMLRYQAEAARHLWTGQDVPG